jgi:3-phenylpropionate/trans-cinnamate dioxygenase ferredoxin reductase subunit
MTGRTFVIVGASLAGVTAAQTLRDEGFDGRVVLVGQEPLPPYERPGLSKGFLRGELPVEQLFARPEGWYEENDVELRTGMRVTGLDVRDRRFALDDGSELGFDAALIATGASDRALQVPGARLPGVLGLRTVQDSQAIRDAASARGHVVVVGMGFIGAEVAASLRRMGLEVTVVEVFDTALLRALGSDAGRVMERVHRERGVGMRFGRTVESIEGEKHASRVRISGGEILECDVVVVGIGVTPNVGLWPLGLAADGGIPVGPTLETEVADVFAAGDVASHDHPIFGPIVGPLRVEHYDNAIRMGEIAARNMLGADLVYDDPHSFWSEQYEERIEVAGIVPPNATTVLRGSYENGSFCAFSLDRTGVLRAAASVGWPRDVRRAMKPIRAESRPDPAALADRDVDVRTLA